MIPSKGLSGKSGRTMGPITGVIHGAGLNVPRLINQVSIQEALQEVSPKILGIINLMAELKESPPRVCLSAFLP